MNDDRTPRRRSLLGTGVALPIVVGLAGLMTIMSRPRFAMFHSVDVLQLIATGMCFGVALATLGVIVRRRGPD